MLSGSTKKFFIFICIALAMIATLGMTPETKRKELMKPVTALYKGSDSDSTDELSSVSNAEAPKVIVKPDDAKEDYLNVNNELLPISDESKTIEDYDNDSGPNSDKLDAAIAADKEAEQEKAKEAEEEAKQEATLDEVPV